MSRKVGEHFRENPLAHRVIRPYHRDSPEFGWWPSSGRLDAERILPCKEGKTNISEGVINKVWGPSHDPPSSASEAVGGGFPFP